MVLWTNYFELKGIKSETELYRYSVGFSDNELPKPKKKRLIQLLLRLPAFTAVSVSHCITTVAARLAGIY